MKSILYIQHGDYAEAFERFAQGGTETFRDQRASVDHAASLARDARVTVFAFSGRDHEQELAPNLTAIATSRNDFSTADARRLFASVSASHVILCTPMAAIIAAAGQDRVALLPLFADTFRKGRLRAWFRNRKLSRLLRQTKAPCFANNSRNASLSLRDVLHLPADRIVPWEHASVPVIGQPKGGVAEGSEARLLFAGSLSESKGVGDLLDAVAILSKARVQVRLTLVGGGDTAAWKARASERGVLDRVDFKGLVPNEEVRRSMSEHDIVLVPSRHDYAEGLPNVLIEALSSHTPVVVSDHPAFADRLDHNACEVFRAGKPADLAKAVTRVLSEPGRYESMSSSGQDAARSLAFGIDRHRLIDLFLDDPDNSTGWVKTNSLETLLGQTVQPSVPSPADERS